MRAKLLSLLSVLGLLAWGTVSAAQDPPPPPPPKPAEQAKPPAKKAKKVWTGEDLKDLRRPADRYVEQKEKTAEEAAKAEAAKKEADAKAAEGAGNPEEEITPEWKTPEVLERQVGEYDEKIEDTKALIEKSRQAMLASKNQEEYDSAKLDYETHLENLEYLQKRAAELKTELEAAKKKAKPKEEKKAEEPPAKPPTP